MLSRRSFVQKTSAAVLSAAMIPGFAMGQGNHSLKKFGFIEGIIGKELKGDWKSVLKKTVEYGFSEIEIGNYKGESAQAFLNYCHSIGIKPVVKGIPFTNDGELLSKSLDELDELEIKQAVTYWPWMSGGPFKLEDCKKSVPILNTMGEVCQKRGIRFSWHNHDKEFLPMQEGLPFDYLMKHTDKNLVGCELDVFWAVKGGANPVAILKKFAGRFPILHLKDMTADERQTFECVGSGTIDFPAILKEASNQNIQHFFVEYDNVVDGMACLKNSGEYLQNLKF